VAPNIGEGAFVVTNFPFGPPDPPDQPGPVPHIAYCLGVRQSTQGPELLLAYTSSGPWRPGGHSIPVGVIEFDRSAARAVNQVPFHLDLRVLARVPPSARWLPRLDTTGGGIVAMADSALRDRIAAEARRLANRHPDVIEVRGVRHRR
jgi:hypothetical protein